MSDKLKNTLFSTSSIIIIFILWQLYSISIDNQVLMPSPIHVFESLIDLLKQPSTYETIIASLSRLLISLSLALVAGTVLGFLSGVNERVEAILKPIITTIRTLPVISIIIVILIIFGNQLTLYIISLLLLFPVIYQAELDGIKHIDSLLIDVLKLESDHTNIDVFKHVYFPLSIPHLRTAIINAVGLGFKVLVVAEYIAQSKVSIGKEIYNARINLEFSQVFAWTILLLVLVLVIETLVEKLLKVRN